MSLNTKGLKALALKLPKDSELRDVLLSEKEEISAVEALSKIDIWLRLSALEQRRGKGP